MSSKENTALFTGHRVIAASEKAALLADLYSTVLDAVLRGYTDFYCGLAMGFDLMAGECVLSLKERFPEIKLHVLIPSKDQTRNWPTAEIERHDAVRAGADSIDYIADTHFQGCEIVRNKKMVDLSSLCIAYMKSVGSGTGSTVKYAEKCGIPVINLCREKDQLTFEVNNV